MLMSFVLKFHLRVVQDKRNRYMRLYAFSKIVYRHGISPKANKTCLTVEKKMVAKKAAMNVFLYI